MLENRGSGGLPECSYNSCLIFCSLKLDIRRFPGRHFLLLPWTILLLCETNSKKRQLINKICCAFYWIEEKCTALSEWHPGDQTFKQGQQFKQ